MNNIINDCIETAAKINKIKLNAVMDVEKNLNCCPSEYLSATKKLIENIRTNINFRNKFIDELKTNKFQDEIDILVAIGKLEELDDRDAQAVDIYKALMDELI